MKTQWYYGDNSHWVKTSQPLTRSDTGAALEAVEVTAQVFDSNDQAVNEPVILSPVTGSPGHYAAALTAAVEFGQSYLVRVKAVDSGTGLVGQWDESVQVVLRGS